MARYIDADRFRKHLELAMEKMHLIRGIKAVDVWAVVKSLDNAPTADVVEVKHGENIGTLHPVDEFICSECGIVLEGWTKVVTDEDDGEMYFYEYEFKYCPNCGARMDGGGK